MEIRSRDALLRGIIVVVMMALTTGRANARDPHHRTQATGADDPVSAVKGNPGPPQIRPSKNLPPGDYIIGSDDILAVSVWREPEISRVIPVRPDGRISLPLIGELRASGLAPLKLQADITEHLKAYLSNPEVTVIVQEVKSQKFNIVGEVQKPGIYYLAKPMAVLDAIAMAGGVRDFARVKKIYVLRRNSDGPRIRIPFNYKEIIKGKSSSQDVTLEAGDTVVVP